MMQPTTEADYAPVQFDEPEAAEAAPARPSRRERRLQRRFERAERRASMTPYDRWRRGLRIRRTIGVLLILGIVGGIAYVIFGTDIGSTAVAQAQPVVGPVLGFLSDARDDPSKAMVTLGGLLITKIGLIFLFEDLFAPNARR